MTTKISYLAGVLKNSLLVKPDLTKRGQSLFPNDNDNGDRDQLLLHIEFMEMMVI